EVGAVWVVLQKPGGSAAKYASCDRPFTPETAIDRPPRSGPTLRQRNELKNVVSAAGSTGCCAAACCAFARNCQAADTKRRKRATLQNETRFMRRSLADRGREHHERAAASATRSPLSGSLGAAVLIGLSWWADRHRVIR